MIQLEHLSKRYGDFSAVEDLNLTIETGEFFGLLGPNGAGKTTTISMISSLVLPSSGRVLLDGEELTRQRPELKRKVSVVTQEYSMRQDMNMLEIMKYQGLLYHMSGKQIRERTEELLEFAELIDYRYRSVRRLSGGMKRKLMVCRALLTEPDIILLDEPTAGMDALSRRQMWSMLRRLNDRKLTILLTTHYMEEAESLCSRVALLNRGRISEVSTPQAMIHDLGDYAVDCFEDDETRSFFFPSREEAVAFLSTRSRNTTLRATTLEDVFVRRIAESRKEAKR